MGTGLLWTGWKEGNDNDNDYGELPDGKL